MTTYETWEKIPPFQLTPITVTDAPAGMRLVAAEDYDRLREALTPSAETKAAYMHEFRMTIPGVGDDGAEYTRTVNIPWTTIKEIMAAIRNRANNEGASR